MSIDLSQFYEVFFDESREHLAGLESILVAMDVTHPETEDINAVFRAAHSIKGSSGTFGFTDVTDVTHVMETLLDQVRQGERAITTEIVDVCLRAGDVLKNLLDAHQNGGEADRLAADQVRKELNDICLPQKNTTHSWPGYAIQSQIMGAKPEDLPELKDRLLAELAEIGTVSDVSFSPEGALSLKFDSPIELEGLRSILEFVIDPRTLSITMLGESHGVALQQELEDEGFGLFEPLADANQPRPSASEEDEGFGFFDPLPPPVARLEDEAPSAPGASESMEAEDGSFGFFTAIPEHAPGAPVAQAQTKNASVIPAAGKAAPAKATHNASESGSIRVSVDKVDQMINLVGELVITQAMLSQAASRCDPVVFEDLLNSIAHLERNTRNLQESVMSVRMLPISMVFSRFPRVVRDLSQKLGKHVQLVEYGESTELDKTLVERITDPLTHLVRNSLDHGIESPAARKAAGKTEVGTITLRAYHQSGNIVIEVSDDGAGLRRDKILAKARERGLNVHDAMSDQEVWMLIFEPGFSTAEQVTEVSGRGVGMDVVRRNISELGGRIEIDSVPEVGTRVVVRLPLTLAILDGMSVRVGDETYIIPLDYVAESLQAAPGMIKSVSGQQCLLQVRGDFLPVLRLRELFGVPGTAPSLHVGIMVVLESDGVKAAVFVDELIGQYQFVIKSLEANYRRIGGIAGATILGDGQVALIVDAAALVAAAKRAVSVVA